MIEYKVMDEIDIALLDQAMDYSFDVLDRSQVGFMLLGDTAYSVLNNTHPKYQKVSLGVKQQDLHEFGVATLMSWVPGITNDGHKIKFQSPEGVPVEIRIITKDYPFFQNPQDFLFRMDLYKLPNPFEPYWKMYRLIQ